MNETTMRVLRRDHVQRLVKGIVTEWFTDSFLTDDGLIPLEPGDVGMWDASDVKDCLPDLIDRLTEELA